MMDKTLVISWLHFLNVFIVHTFFFLLCVLSGTGAEVYIRPVCLTPTHLKLVTLRTLAEVIDNERTVEIGRGL